MRNFDWDKQLTFSRGVSAGAHEDTIQKLLTGCVKVTQAPVELDVQGIDYIAELRGGAPVQIDVKARDVGCSQFWKASQTPGKKEPELALENWSVTPSGEHKGKTGWTLDESKLTDYTLHVFDESDTDEVFLLPFQILRMVFREQIGFWFKRYFHARQSTTRGNSTWQSECVYVPACEVLDRIRDKMRGLYPRPVERPYDGDPDPLTDPPEVKAAIAKQLKLFQ